MQTRMSSGNNLSSNTLVSILMIHVAQNHVAFSSWESIEFTMPSIRDADLSEVGHLSHKTIYWGHHLFVLLMVPQICRSTKQQSKPTRRHYSRMPEVSAPPCTQRKSLQQDPHAETAEFVLVKLSDLPCKTSLDIHWTRCLFVWQYCPNSLNGQCLHLGQLKGSRYS